ncbi:hypothetical protein [Lactococcus sp.]|uniref:hypothetical protein n=1 Tax=Lactococcus sp. TaxID=44273 RepID=UPI0035AE6179
MEMFQNYEQVFSIFGIGLLFATAYELCIFFEKKLTKEELSVIKTIPLSLVSADKSVQTEKSSA